MSRSAFDSRASHGICSLARSLLCGRVSDLTFPMTSSSFCGCLVGSCAMILSSRSMCNNVVWTQNTAQRCTPKTIAAAAGQSRNAGTGLDHRDSGISAPLLLSRSTPQPLSRSPPISSPFLHCPSRGTDCLPSCCRGRGSCSGGEQGASRAEQRASHGKSIAG